MEDLHRLNSTSCTELERLAAAAATMGYSDSLVSAHQPALSVGGAVLPPQFPPDHYQRQYSRHESAPRTTYEQVPRHPPPNAHHQPAPPAHAHTPPTVQYITERAPPYPRGGQFLPMVEMQYTNAAVVAPTTHPEPQYQAPAQEPMPPPVTPAAPTNPITTVKEKKKTREAALSKKRKGAETVNSLGQDMLIEDEERDSSMIEIPSPIEEPGGGLVYPCGLCGVNLHSPELWQDHQIENHAANGNKRRNGLSLEIKIEIIKRINSGEKQGDMAEEYMVNRSTIKSIMKKSDSYLQCWKKGMFHPDSKRLKGPKREDIEAALYSWYKQAISTGTPVSGPILCTKALAFATKLGHTDFRATHGWLDRFKKRKNIVFGRTPTRRKREEEENGAPELKPGEWQTAVLPQLLHEYEPNDVFAVEEIGLLYRTLPNIAPSLRGERCAGGIRSRLRLTVLLCGNMAGTEKFPLLVVGKHPKPSSFRHVKSLPVQYVANQKAWMTSDSFGAWLQDVDSWFVQQGRRVVVLAAALPVHVKPPGSLRSVRLVTAPIGFLGPLRHGVVIAFKRNYRRGILETLVNQLQRDEPVASKRTKRQNTKISLLTCLHQLATAWHSVSDAIINASFTRAGVSKYGAWGAPPPPPDPSMGAENLTLLHRLRTLNLHIPDMTFDDFVHFDDDVQVCNLNNDDDILAVVTGADKDDDLRYDDEEEDQDEEEEENGDSERGPSLSDVEGALATLRKHIQYQEGAQEMFRVLAHLEYLIYKGQAGGKGVCIQPTTPNPH